jgi:hypothetical protein
MGDEVNKNQSAWTSLQHPISHSTVDSQNEQKFFQFVSQK